MVENSFGIETAQVFIMNFMGSQYPQFGARERGRGGFAGFGFGVRVRCGIRLDKLTNRLDKNSRGVLSTIGAGLEVGAGL
jgi:hypothetical protein